ncbi:MAG TPA: DUF1553 domain-containing protein [Verrucomicrobiales bacterium]|nr:DUF1553 domain-containing protein [Verrucomicrobiales bacterium]
MIIRLDFPRAILMGWMLTAAAAWSAPGGAVDFNRDIRPLLSNNCFLCHGPDAAERKADLRLDTPEGAREERDGVVAIVPGRPESSELARRIRAENPGDRMPPSKSGKSLTKSEQELLEQWIREGAPYATHWSYVKPVRPPIPAVRDSRWPKTAADHFILARLEAEGLGPSPEADRPLLARRAALDLTGLPPDPEDLAAFLADQGPLAFEHYVDSLLRRPSYGEHWARMWLDLARYADSAGYADDPPRTIWAYRDYVIRAFNDNTPFDRFTIEQMAGDLLPDPAAERLVATAFHRNTQTNNEGGTSDEEYRNVAVADRVNTTMSVWMGTTMACAQCHSHKYDPISQTDYFRLFALLNNTEDADRTDESPTAGLFSEDQKRKQAAMRDEIARLEKQMEGKGTRLEEGQAAWEEALRAGLEWRPLQPSQAASTAGAELRILEDASVLASGPAPERDAYLITTAVPSQPVTALRLEAIPDETLPDGGPGRAEGRFVLTGLKATLEPSAEWAAEGRFVRIALSGSRSILSLAEVQVFAGETNVALEGEASQSSTAFDGPARLAVDGDPNGDYSAGSTTHTRISDDPWWEVDLKTAARIGRIVVWNRTDGGESIGERLEGLRISVLDDERRSVYELSPASVPAPSGEYQVDGRVDLEFSGAFSPSSGKGFEARQVLRNPDPAQKGWALDGPAGEAGELILSFREGRELSGRSLLFRLEQEFGQSGRTLGRFRLSWTGEPVSAAVAQTPARIRDIVALDPGNRSAEQQAEAARFYRSVAPELAEVREQAMTLRRQLEEMKPETTVPVLLELPEDKRRVTLLQHRGNFLDTGEEVAEGLPEAFHPAPSGNGKRLDRMDLAQWLVSRNNPLTARVTVNRYWEKLFGAGLVLTSEEFGSQGEPPSHPELLDWLAVEFMESGWDLKGLLHLLVTSAAYRQSSRVDPALLERDPANHLLARGPRYRLPAESIRDQALAVSGLLSPKMFGPPVRPPQPSAGLTAAFGGGIDWETSAGEDRYRRGLYTTWRRSSPYPSMSTFDAPNREVCTVRRERTNTPLQALVTLNDPVFIEAAQALGRRLSAVEGDVRDRVRQGFRMCLVREPSDGEIAALARLYDDARDSFGRDASAAVAMATDPLGPLPEGAAAADLAAWTVISNVLLNLDEFLMRP